MDKREKVANDIINVFKEFPEINDVFLRGSLFYEYKKDKYSDIDIGIDVSGFDNGSFAKELPNLMNENFNILFHDWSPSLLPKDYVITFFLKDYPIFWFVDIQVTAIPHHPSLKKVRVNKYHHLLKLWILILKHYIRGIEEAEFEIKKLANRTFNNNIKNNDLFYLMSQIINEVDSNVESDLKSFVDECKNELINHKTFFN